MNELQHYIFNDQQIRTVMIDNNPYFVGKDVAQVLGYKDTADAIKRHVDNEDKLTRGFTDSGQGREMYVINESGLYSLILSSKLPTAKQFKRWVTSEVLPDIRKHGMYAKKDLVDQMLQDPDAMITILTNYKNERERRLIAEQRISELQPKATYYDLILQNKSLVSVSQIAKDYGKSARWLNQKLRDLGVQYKQSNTWLLYQKYATKGYTQSTTHVIDDQHSKMFTKWTQKGRWFIYDLLKQSDILPLIELEGA